MENFYKTLNLQYPEEAILLEKVKKKDQIGKFFIPILTPTISNTTIFDTKKQFEEDEYIVSNYILLTIPSYLFPNNIPISCNKSCDGYNNNCAYIDSINDSYFEKGQKFIIVFIGGDINNIQIIGVKS